MSLTESILAQLSILFLSSYRFNKPMGEVTRAALPMLGVLLVGVLLITYIPWLTTWLPSVIRTR